MSRTSMAVVLFCLAILQMGCRPDTGYQTPPVPKVSVATPVIETVPIYLVENGETEAVEQAVVQARVRGILGPLKPEANSVVKEGDELFVIDPEEYETARDAALATVSSAKASLVTAKAAIGVADARIEAAEAAVKVAEADVGRLKGLLDSKAVAQSEFDAAQAQLESSIAARQGSIAAKSADEAKIVNAEAQLENAEASLRQAELNLEWTVVKAPIDGRITRTLVKRGNLVENGTSLIEIVQDNPIWANFTVNERFLLNLERSAGRGEGAPADPTKVKVRLQRAGDVGFPFEGHLDYYDPKIDQDTGTLTLRAVFENGPDAGVGLLPGLFVRVQIQIGSYENATLIPERAINRDQAGIYVYVLGAENKAVRKNVTLGNKHNEMIVVTSGLEPSDSVIVDGIQRVRPGAVVDPS